MSPPGHQHSTIAKRFAVRLGIYAETYGGEVHGEVGVWIQHDPDTVRTLDAAYVTPARVKTATPWFMEFLPELVVEVVSPNDTAKEVRAKVVMWLDSGIRLV